MMPMGSRRPTRSPTWRTECRIPPSGARVHVLEVEWIDFAWAGTAGALSIMPMCFITRSVPLTPASMAGSSKRSASPPS